MINFLWTQKDGFIFAKLFFNFLGLISQKVLFFSATMCYNEIKLRPFNVDADLPRNRVFDILLLTFFEEKICALSKAEFFLPNIRN